MADALLMPPSVLTTVLLEHLWVFTAALHHFSIRRMRLKKVGEEDRRKGGEE